MGSDWDAMRGPKKKVLEILAEMGFEPGTRGVGSRLITISAILSVMVESLDWLLDGYMEGFGRIRSWVSRTCDSGSSDRRFCKWADVKI